MANMSYCRFEKTSKDLQDCLEGLREAGSIKAYIEDSNQYEIPHVTGIFEIMREMIDEFGEELQEILTNH